jgi:hypothetical protein
MSYKALTKLFSLMGKRAPERLIPCLAKALMIPLSQEERGRYFRMIIQLETGPLLMLSMIGKESSPGASEKSSIKSKNRDFTSLFTAPSYKSTMKNSTICCKTSIQSILYK